MNGAKLQLKAYLASEDFRYGVLEAFFADNGFVFDASDKSISAANAFYVDSVFSNEEKTDIDMKWVFFAWHYGLFLGNVAIKRAGDQGINLKWTVRDVSIPGFEDGVRPEFVISTGRNRLFEWAPDEVIMRCGRFVIQHGGPQLTPKPAVGPDSPYDMFNWFIHDRLKFA